jgi:hypothetical protein
VAAAGSGRVGNVAGCRLESRTGLTGDDSARAAKILTQQVNNAPGGARNHVVNGKLIGGVPPLGSPASYLASGVKTFPYALDDAIHEKDLGRAPSVLAAKITAGYQTPDRVGARQGSWVVVCATCRSICSA